MSFDPLNCVNQTVLVSGESNFTVQCGFTYAPHLGDETPFSWNGNSTKCVDECNNRRGCIATTVDIGQQNCSLFSIGNQFAVVSDTPNRWSAWKSGGQDAIAEPNLSSTITPSATATTTSSSAGNSNSTESATTSPTSNNSSSTSSATPSSSPNASNSFSAGTVAGAAVGAAIGAAILAFIAAFFLFRRRRPRGESVGGPLKSDKGLPSHPWEVYLPQPADDGKLTSAVSILFAQINQHVENYYGDHFQREQFERSRGFLNTIDSGRLQKPLEQLMPEMREPLPVIKHSFASVILEKMSPASSPDDTLLPAEYARAPPRLGAAYRSGSKSESVNRAYDYWRVLTAYLMYPNLASNGARGDQVGPAGSWIVDVLTTAFAPWAKSSKAGQDHLNSVLKTASDTGLLIASQPSSFAFEWDVLQKEDGKSVVVSPALIKTTDEHGETLSQPQVLVKPKVETIQ